MTLFLSYLISFFLGFLIVLNLETIRKNTTLSFSISLGLGLGISSLLTFLSLVLVNEYSPKTTILLNLITLTIICFYSRKRISTLKTELTASLKGTMLKDLKILKLSFWLFFLCFIPILYILAKEHPFGEWDAWALWNMKFKFLVLSGDSWRALFNELHWHTQPDYPLLIPSLHAWGFAFSNQNPHMIPLFNSVIFAFLNGLLIYGALKQFIDERISFCAALLLILNPYYIYVATAQYADTAFSFYLLATLALITFALKEKEKNTLYLAGLMMGLLTFTKNEGIVIALLLVVISSLYILSQKKTSKKNRVDLIKLLCLGLVITSALTVFFKLFLAPSNKDIILNLGFAGLKFFNFEGLLLILQYALFEVFSPRWFYLWVFILFMVLTGFRKIFYEETTTLSLFFISYGFVLLFVYLTTQNFDLTWRLSRTLHRIYFYLLPSIVFYSFYLHWRNKEPKKNK